MAWTIFHGRGCLIEAGYINPRATGWTIDTRRTETAAVEYACHLVREGHGVHSVWERGSDEPKYRHEDFVRMVTGQRHSVAEQSVDD